MPADLFIKVFGEFIPRPCVDVAIIGPEDVFHSEGFEDDGLTPWYSLSPCTHGVLLSKRVENPRMGQWGMPGGTMYVGETPAEAAKRIAMSTAKLDIEVLGSIGHMHFPREERQMEVRGETVNFVIDSLSIVMLARARHASLPPGCEDSLGWFKNGPPVVHEYHIPFLRDRCLLS